MRCHGAGSWQPFTVTACRAPPTCLGTSQTCQGHEAHRLPPWRRRRRDPAHLRLAGAARAAAAPLPAGLLLLLLRSVALGIQASQGLLAWPCCIATCVLAHASCAPPNPASGTRRPCPARPTTAGRTPISCWRTGRRAWTSRQADGGREQHALSCRLPAGRAACVAWTGMLAHAGHASII